MAYNVQRRCVYSIRCSRTKLSYDAKMSTLTTTQIVNIIENTQTVFRDVKQTFGKQRVSRCCRQLLAEDVAEVAELDQALDTVFRIGNRYLLGIAFDLRHAYVPQEGIPLAPVMTYDFATAFVNNTGMA